MLSVNGSVIGFPYSPNYSYILSFEAAFDKEYHREWMSRNWTISAYLSVLYVCVAFAGQKWMSTRRAYDVRTPLIVWNILLSLFSGFGASRTLPELSHVLSQYGVHFSICDRSYVEFNKIAGCWAWIFTLSKGLELLDTIFIVLRKRKLIPLHWLHHISALMTSWYIYSDHPAMGRYMMTCNYTVHAVMYAYFALRACRISVPRWIAMFITTSQIVQMIICFTASLYAFVVKAAGGNCGISWHSAITVFLVYGTFFSLFVHFFVGSYLVQGHKGKRVQKED